MLTSRWATPSATPWALAGDSCTLPAASSPQHPPLLHFQCLLPLTLWVLPTSDLDAKFCFWQGQSHNYQSAGQNRRKRYSQIRVETVWLWSPTEEKEMNPLTSASGRTEIQGKATNQTSQRPADRTYRKVSGIRTRWETSGRKHCRTLQIPCMLSSFYLHVYLNKKKVFQLINKTQDRATQISGNEGRDGGRETAEQVKTLASQVCQPELDPQGPSSGGRTEQIPCCSLTSTRMLWNSPPPEPLTTINNFFNYKEMII